MSDHVPELMNTKPSMTLRFLESCEVFTLDEFMAAGGGKRCKPGFRYSSDTNTDWLTVDQLRDLIRANVDSEFAPR